MVALDLWSLRMTELAEIDRLVYAIMPLLAGKPVPVQGAALADLLSIWLAGHLAATPAATERWRAELLEHHLSVVRRLIPENERAILRRVAERARRGIPATVEYRKKMPLRAITPTPGGTMSEPIEFDCCDCGRAVVGFGYQRVPENRLCWSCDWIREFLPPEHQAAARERMGVPLKTTHAR